MCRSITLVVLALALPASQAQVQPDAHAEAAAIRATALDYMEGWYTRDAARMERAVHPELAKRIVNTNPQNGRNSLGQQSAMTLVQATRTATPVAEMQKDVVILDVFGNTASVRATMTGWVDYMHMAKWNGRWVIVNVLWALKPAAQ
jgi:hypothetical protein